MLNTISIKVVFDRKHQASKRMAYKPVAGLVQLSVSVNKERKFISTGIKVFADEWTAGFVIGRADAQELNDRIANITREVIRIVNECDRQKRLFSFTMLDRIFHSQDRTSWTDWMEKTIKDRALADGTRKHHLKVLRWLQEQDVIYCSQITTGTIIRLDNELHKRKIAGKKMMQTSIYDYHKVLKAYINLAITAGLLEQNPYDHFRISKGTGRPREILTMEEIIKIQKMKTFNKYIKHVRDLFLVQIYTGLSFCDLMTVDFSKQEGNIIKGFRGKTQIAFTTMYLEPVKRIVKYYRGHLPKMAYDDYRRMLMPMATACGITKKITSHTGRHTFATTIALDNGVPIEAVQKMLGHTSIKTTQIYAKMQDKAIGRLAADLRTIGVVNDSH